MSNQEMEMKAREHDVSDISGEAVAEAAEAITAAAAEEVTSGYKKIENGVVSGYKKIEDVVIGGYKKIEDSVVGGFGKVSDKFVEKFFAREGESVADAKKRLGGEK